MSTDPLMSAILDDLARGRIDASEAARRIDALKAAPAEDRSEPDQVGTSAAPPTPPRPAPDDRATDPWAAATDRPQHATFARETVGPERETVGPERETASSAGPGTTVPAAEATSTTSSSSTSSTSSTGANGASPTAAGPRGKAANGVERISVRAVGRRVRIVGETSVATLSADGPHVLRRNGTTLEVSSDGEIGPSLDGFSILRGVPRSLEDIRALGLGKELLLRVNPALAVDVEVTAGQLTTERVPHLGKVRVTAGGAKLLDVTEVNDVLVQAGSATIKGTITSGRHRVRAESGSLTITLGDDSNVTVKSDAQLGRVSWAGGHSGAGDEVVMGNGNARLDVEVVMGHAQVRVGSDAPAASGTGAA